MRINVQTAEIGALLSDEAAGKVLKALLASWSGAEPPKLEDGITNFVFTKLLDNLSPAAEKRGEEKERIIEKEIEGGYIDKERKDIYISNISSLSLSPDSQLTLPIQGGGTWRPTEEMVTSLAEKYPGTDFAGQFQRMREYLGDNPLRLREASIMTNFVEPWLKKNQEYSAKRSKKGSSSPADIPTTYLPPTSGPVTQEYMDYLDRAIRLVRGE